MEGKPGRPGDAKFALEHDKTIERATEFSHRLVGWWKRVILGQVVSGQKGLDAIEVLVVTHGGVITPLTRELVESKEVRCGHGVIMQQCMNTSITVIEVYEDGKGELVRFGDVDHLQKMEVPLASNPDIESLLSRGL